MADVSCHPVRAKDRKAAALERLLQLFLAEDLVEARTPILWIRALVEALAEACTHHLPFRHRLMLWTMVVLVMVQIGMASTSFR